MNTKLSWPLEKERMLKKALFGKYLDILPKDLIELEKFAKKSGGRLDYTIDRYPMKKIGSDDIIKMEVRIPELLIPVYNDINLSIEIIQNYNNGGTETKLSLSKVWRGVYNRPLPLSELTEDQFDVVSKYLKELFGDKND